MIRNRTANPPNALRYRERIHRIQHADTTHRGLHFVFAGAYCCFSQNDSNPCDAEPPITQGMPTAAAPSAAAETQPSATAPTPTCPQKSRLRRESDPLVLSSSTAASASLRTAESCTVSAASITSASGG